MAVNVSPCDRCQQELSTADLLDAMDYMIERLELVCDKLCIPVEIYMDDSSDEEIIRKKRRSLSCSRK